MAAFDGDSLPLAGAGIAINAERGPRDRQGGEARDDRGDLAGACDDRVGLVGTALPLAAGMRVHVGDDGEAMQATQVPQLVEIPPLRCTMPVSRHADRCRRRERSR